MAPRKTSFPGTLRKSRSGFSLLELLVGMAIFTVLLVIFTSIVNLVFRAWETSKHQTEVSQNARAIISLIEQDLTPAVVSTSMQFGQNPSTLSGKLPSSETLVANSDSVFWWGPTTGATAGFMHLSQFGWYLSKKADPNGGGTLYTLNRYNRRFAITDPPMILPGNADTPNRVYWFDVNTTAAQVSENSRIVATGVIGMWIECLDRNGNAIPPRAIDPTKPRFNSAERFQISPAGQMFEDGTSFHYTASTGTIQAHMLPSSVRVTLLLADEMTIRRHPNIPAAPAYTLNQDTTAVINNYRQDLVNQGIAASVFTTSVRLVNSPP